VLQGLGGRVGYILEGGAARIGVESTIVDIRDEAQPILLRPGAITREQLERVLGVEVRRKRPAAAGRPMVAPGLMARHYSPRTAVELHQHLGAPTRATDAYVYFERPSRADAAGNVFSLSKNGSLRSAAQRLFALLRQLDDGRFRRIHIELAPGGGLADAINDRLRRAAAR
jgi:L-threonylcarbamoyladenylate synthase